MQKKSHSIVKYLIASMFIIQCFGNAASASDSSEASLRAKFPTAPEQGFAATCPGGTSFGWLSGVFLEFPGYDIGDIEGDTPQPPPSRTGYYVGAYQYTLVRKTHKHNDSIIFCYDGDLKPGHPATVLNAWIIPATSRLKTCILTESSKRLICSQ